MSPDLTDDDKAAPIELLRETIERDRFPVVAEGQAAEGDPGEARSTNATPGATAGAETAGRAQRRAGEEAAEVDDTCYRRSTVTISLSI
jgi:hypothetical protein